MEFRDIITAGILHEISDKAKKRLKTAGKIGAGAAALGGAAYLAHQHLTGNNSGDVKTVGHPTPGNADANTGSVASKAGADTKNVAPQGRKGEAMRKATARDTLHASKPEGEAEWERTNRAESRAGAEKGGHVSRLKTKLTNLQGFGIRNKK